MGRSVTRPAIMNSPESCQMIVSTFTRPSSSTSVGCVNQSPFSPSGVRIASITAARSAYFEPTASLSVFLPACAKAFCAFAIAFESAPIGRPFS
jgi:hypothetical protein